MNFIPDSHQLLSIFSLAAGPAFLLGAVAGFVSLLMLRLKGVLDQLGRVIATDVGGSAQARHNQDVAQLKRRAILLNSAARLALAAGISTTLLLMISFGSAFLRLQHVYGAALLFAIASGLLTVALYKFAQEVRAELTEINRYGADQP